MIFSELYSAYYNTVAKIMEAAGSRGCPSARPRMTEKCEHIR